MSTLVFKQHQHWDVMQDPAEAMTPDNLLKNQRRGEKKWIHRHQSTTVKNRIIIEVVRWYINSTWWSFPPKRIKNGNPALIMNVKNQRGRGSLFNLSASRTMRPSTNYQRREQHPSYLNAIMDICIARNKAREIDSRSFIRWTPASEGQSTTERVD